MNKKFYENADFDGDIFADRALVVSEKLQTECQNDGRGYGRMDRKRQESDKKVIRISFPITEKTVKMK